MCTHGDELAGLQLFLQHPYGKNSKVEWKVVIGNPEAITLNKRFIETDLNRSFNAKQAKSYEEQRAEILKKIFPSYDVLYDIHTTQMIKYPNNGDCIFVNSVEKNVIDESKYVQSKNIIWDSDPEYVKQYLTAHHLV